MHVGPSETFRVFTRLDFDHAIRAHMRRFAAQRLNEVVGGPRAASRRSTVSAENVENNFRTGAIAFLSAPGETSLVCPSLIRQTRNWSDDSRSSVTRSAHPLIIKNMIIKNSHNVTKKTRDERRHESRPIISPVQSQLGSILTPALGPSEHHAEPLATRELALPCGPSLGPSYLAVHLLFSAHWRLFLAGVQVCIPRFFGSEHVGNLELRPGSGQ
jgi:hypothetical protein